MPQLRYFDDHYVYVFVRQDVPLAAQIVNACHAALHATLMRLTLSG